MAQCSMTQGFTPVSDDPPLLDLIPIKVRWKGDTCILQSVPSNTLSQPHHGDAFASIADDSVFSSTPV